MTKQENQEIARLHYETRKDRRPKQTWGGHGVGWVKS